MLHLERLLCEGHESLTQSLFCRLLRADDSKLSAIPASHVFPAFVFVGGYRLAGNLPVYPKAQRRSARVSREEGVLEQGTKCTSGLRDK